jgi:hypothetical protein
MQYLVPGICLLAGVGGASALARIRWLRLRTWTLAASLLVLAVIEVAPLVLDTRHPYRAVHAQRARQFARRFWPELAVGGVPVCLRWDLGLAPWDSQNLNVAVYLCNQRIYSPPRRQGTVPRWSAASESMPLRCVLPMADPAGAHVAAWLVAMQTRYRLRTSQSVLENMAEPGAPPRLESYVIYEFVPRCDGPTSALALGRRFKKENDAVEQRGTADLDDVGVAGAGDLDERPRRGQRGRQ